MRNADDFIADLPADEKSIVVALRKIVKNASDRLEEKLSYGVPYYYGYSRICFIWPASAGAITIDKGVILGFCRGHLLSNENGLLEGRGRKEVWDVIYEHPSQIEPAKIHETLMEAILVDEEMAPKKKRR